MACTRVESSQNSCQNFSIIMSSTDTQRRYVPLVVPFARLWASHPIKNLRLPAVSWYYGGTWWQLTLAVNKNVNQICTKTCHFTRARWSAYNRGFNEQPVVTSSLGESTWNSGETLGGFDKLASYNQFSNLKKRGGDEGVRKRIKNEKEIRMRFIK